jgi:transaldolase
VSELTARINDEGWDTSYSSWLQCSKISKNDCLLVFSVGGGNRKAAVSVNLITAISVSKNAGASILGVVGRDGGYTAQNADACVIIPTVDAGLLTPLAESFQALIWHLLATHPDLNSTPAKWEGLGHSTPKQLNRSRRTLPHDLSGIKLFADGASIESILEAYRNPMISGFTTNPTLMRGAGISDYRAFAQHVLRHVSDKPISFQVLSEDFKSMEREAQEIASWGENVYVKIPITNILKESSVELIGKLSNDGIKINITAIMTTDQIRQVLPFLTNSSGACLSVFAGRIADTGVDPIPTIREAASLAKHMPQIEVIWASPREVLNVFQAKDAGCHIITVTQDLFKKFSLIGKNLEEYSHETVRMFSSDAKRAGYSI